MYNFIPIPKDTFSIYRLVSNPSDWRIGIEFKIEQQAIARYEQLMDTHYLFEIVYPSQAKEDSDIPPCGVFVYNNNGRTVTSDKIRVI